VFKPLYTISDQLLSNITRINSLVRDMNERRFPNVVLVEFEKNARSLSAYASTSIEGNPLPLTEVKSILKSIPENLRDSEKEVLNYNQALVMLNERINQGSTAISADLVLEIHSRVTVGLLPAHETGRFRQKPVVVNDPRTGSVVYLPPDHDQVKSLVNDVVDYVNTNERRVDPLILAGIFHKQMVIIHPFMDGNGRTTRLATKVLLAKMGLNTFNLFSFENYYNQNVTRYFQFVGERGDYYDLAGKVDFSDWLEYFTGGLIDELLRVSKILPDTNKNPETQLKAHHLQLLDYIRGNGYINDQLYSRLTDRVKATRTLDFKFLIGMGLIERKGKGKATYYILRDSTGDRS